MRQERGGIFSLFSLVARVATRDLQQIFSPKSLRATQTYILWMGRRRKPIIFGLDKAASYQRVVDKPLMVMGFVPLPILHFTVFTHYKPFVVI